MRRALAERQLAPRISLLENGTRTTKVLKRFSMSRRNPRTVLRAGARGAWRRSRLGNHSGMPCHEEPGWAKSSAPDVRLLGFRQAQKKPVPARVGSTGGRDRRYGQRSAPESSGAPRLLWEHEPRAKRGRPGLQPELPGHWPAVPARKQVAGFVRSRGQPDPLVGSSPHPRARRAKGPPRPVVGRGASPVGRVSSRRFPL